MYPKQSVVALVFKEPLSDYGVSFPDFPGCATAGNTLDEAAAMATEALALHIEGMRADGHRVPVLPINVCSILPDPGPDNLCAVLFIDI